MNIDANILIQKLALAKEMGLPFVIFRKPGTEQWMAYIQKDADLITLEHFQQEGFLFSPYQQQHKKILFPKDRCKVMKADIATFSSGDEPLNIKLKVANQLLEIERLQHERMVSKAVQFIKDGNAEKIVLSRKENLQCTGVDSIKLFIKMTRMYPNAFCYLWMHPEVGEWMGATPETLLSVNNGQLQTMALAGTQAYTNTLDVDWGNKEIEEQALVADFVSEKLSSFVPELKSNGPFTSKAGSVLHLRTDFSGYLESDQHIRALLESLHPTPAICGIPRDLATNFIAENEGYPRNFYSGYLGELNGTTATELFVNLRCMQLEKNEINLFIGGGITGESIPEKEWEETVQKAMVMKNVLLN